MKKGMLLISLILIILMSGCGSKSKIDPLDYVRVSKVIEINEDSVVGQIDEKTTTRVPLKEFKGEKIEVGDTIKVTYDYVTFHIRKIEIN